MKISGQPSRGVHTVIFEHCLYTAVERAVPGRDTYLLGILTEEQFILKHTSLIKILSKLREREESTIRRRELTHAGTHHTIIYMVQQL